MFTQKFGDGREERDIRRTRRHAVRNAETKMAKTGHTPARRNRLAELVRNVSKQDATQPKRLQLDTLREDLRDDVRARGNGSVEFEVSEVAEDDGLLWECRIVSVETEFPERIAVLGEEGGEGVAGVVEDELEFCEAGETGKSRFAVVHGSTSLSIRCEGQ